jgi:hypothetical protein
MSRLVLTCFLASAKSSSLLPVERQVARNSMNTYSVLDAIYTVPYFGVKIVKKSCPHKAPSTEE